MGIRRISPGPLAPSNLPSRKMTPRSYSRRIRMAWGRTMAARMISGTDHAVRLNSFFTISSIVIVFSFSCWLWFYLQSQSFNAHDLRRLARLDRSIADRVPVFTFDKDFAAL